MARPLSDLQAILKGMDGVADAYFQPKTGLEYPCIVFERGRASDVKFADNIKYLLKKGYTITVIDYDPASLIPDQVEGLPHCKYDRFFRIDGLNHFVFQLYF